MGTYRKEKRINGAFRILSAIGIVLVVAGHADFHIFDLGGLFPYYSFHVSVFLFISGYFYDDSAEEHIGKYIKHKLASLMAPYFIWNLFYGVLAALLRGNGFGIGEGIGVRTLFIEPFLGGHQYGFNFAAWFVPALFLIEIINVCMRRVLSWMHLRKEWLICGGCLLVGVLTVWLAIGGHVWGYYKFPGRILFMLPVFQAGHLYRVKLEKFDRLPNGTYMFGLLVIQLVIVCSCAGLAYSTVWCSGFVNGPLIPYLTILTGIAFWLRIAKMLEPLFEKWKLAEEIGKNTFSIMMHHILGFMLVKGVFYLLSGWTEYFSDFDAAAFLSDIGYIYVPGGVQVFKWVYLFVGIALPLLIHRITAGRKKQMTREYK